MTSRSTLRNAVPLLVAPLLCATFAFSEGVTITEAGYTVNMPGPAQVVEDKQELGYLRLHGTAVERRAYVAGYSDNLGVDVTDDETLDAAERFFRSFRILQSAKQQ